VGDGALFPRRRCGRKEREIAGPWSIRIHRRGIWESMAEPRRLHRDASTCGIILTSRASGFQQRIALAPLPGWPNNNGLEFLKKKGLEVQILGTLPFEPTNIFVFLVRQDFKTNFVLHTSFLSPFFEFTENSIQNILKLKKFQSFALYLWRTYDYNIPSLVYLLL
jgi:hypothetical protein